MFQLESLTSGRYALIVLPRDGCVAMGRVFIDHRAGVSEVTFESWEIGQFFGGN